MNCLPFVLFCFPLLTLLLPELHDGLSAWGGLGASFGALWNELRFMHHASFDVVMITIFFVVISVLHITVPTVISVEAITRPVDISTNAATMPGRILDFGFKEFGDNSDDELSSSLQNTLLTLPYIYGQRNDSAMTLPRGFNHSYVAQRYCLRHPGTDFRELIHRTFFSWPYESLESDIVFEDNNATVVALHCGVVPRNELFDGYSVSFVEPRKLIYLPYINS